MPYAIWYHLYNLKNVKNTHGGVLLLVTKVTLLHGCFSRFLNCKNGIELRNASMYTHKKHEYDNTIICLLKFISK